MLVLCQRNCYSIWFLYQGTIVLRKKNKPHINKAIINSVNIRPLLKFWCSNKQLLFALVQTIWVPGKQNKTRNQLSKNSQIHWGGKEQILGLENSGWEGEFKDISTNLNASKGQFCYTISVLWTSCKLASWLERKEDVNTLKCSDTLTGHSQSARKGAVTPAHIVHIMNFLHLFFQAVGHCPHTPHTITCTYPTCLSSYLGRLRPVTVLQTCPRVDLWLCH